MASRSVIHLGEESESSAEEAFSDEEVLTSADADELDTSAAVSARGDPPTEPRRTSRARRLPNSVLHHKLREANFNLQNAIKLQIVAPYRRATKNVQTLTYSLSKIQASMSETCLHLQQLREDLKAIEEKTFDVVSSDYLVDVKI